MKKLSKKYENSKDLPAVYLDHQHAQGLQAPDLRGNQAEVAGLRGGRRQSVAALIVQPPS